MKTLLLLVGGLAVICQGKEVGLRRSESDASTYLNNLNNDLNRIVNLDTEASWAYASNIIDFNEKLRNEASAKTAKFLKEVAKELNQFDWQNFKDSDLQRQFKKLAKLGYAALSEKDYDELLATLSKMESNYAKVRICGFKKRSDCEMQLEPELTEVLESSRDPEELKYYWKEWYNKAGTAVRSMFERYVELNGKAALLNNFKSGAEVWLDEYEDDTIEQQLEEIYGQIRPLYEQIHGYVRWRLRQTYGDEIVPEKGPIPMHLLGNMWAQQWSEIASIVSFKSSFRLNKEACLYILKEICRPCDKVIFNSFNT